MNYFRYLSLGILTGFFLLAGSGRVAAAMPERDQVIAKYEKAILLIEVQRLSQKDVEPVKAKVRLAGQALLKEDLPVAEQILDESLAVLEELRKTRPAASYADFRLEWLETYANVFQWFAVLAILSFFLTRWPYFGPMLRENSVSLGGKVLLVGLTAFSAILLSVFDLSRYGESSWMFFDIQLVLVTVSGLLGGIGTGIVSGALVALFRLFLKSGWSIYPVLVLGAGLIGGLFSLRIKSFQESARTALGAGLLVGLIHGCCVFLPIDPLIGWHYVVFAIVLLSILEGTGVALFFAVVGGILREEARRYMHEELLKTKVLFLQAQLRPHFFFNALNTISAICAREKASGAQGLILKLADFLRHTLKREHETASLREEISFIEDYLEIEKARFQDRLQVIKEYKIAETTWQTKIPLLIIQPLVENAVRHGIQKRTAGGWVKIHLEDSAGMLKVEITDNGGGEDPLFFERMLRGEKTEVKGLGIGVRNIHERLKRHYGNEASLIFKTAIGEGTRATVVIPLILEKTS